MRSPTLLHSLPAPAKQLLAFFMEFMYAEIGTFQKTGHIGIQSTDHMEEQHEFFEECDPQRDQ